MEETAPKEGNIRASSGIEIIISLQSFPKQELR
jgi:hypothetical protein